MDLQRRPSRRLFRRADGVRAFIWRREQRSRPEACQTVTAVALTPLSQSFRRAHPDINCSLKKESLAATTSDPSVLE